MMKRCPGQDTRSWRPEDIFDVVERYTSCGIGICGKCSISTGERTCVDGPIHPATEFTPGDWQRDLTGKKVKYPT